MAAAEVGTAVPVTDEDLVEEVRGGDKDAFELLYERYFKRIYHFINRRLNSHADAEETTQEVFINVFASIDSYRGEAPFAAWLFGITRRTIATRFKRNRHTMVPLEDDTDSGVANLNHRSSEPSPLESYEYQERIALMSDTLGRRLGSEQRLLFELHHLQERSISEIATTLNKSEDSVKSNLYRTRKLLLAR